MSNKLKKIINEIESSLDLKYESSLINMERVFKYRDQRFVVTGFNNDGEDVIVVEYGDINTPRTQYEDGNLYYISELTSYDILNKIMNEVELLN